MKKMSKTTMAGLAAVVLWPVAMILGYRGAMVHMAAIAALFLWGMQWINDVPMVAAKKKIGFRQD